MNPYSAELKLAHAVRPCRTKSKAELLDDGFRLTPYATLVRNDDKISVELCNRPVAYVDERWQFTDRDLHAYPLPPESIEWLVLVSELN